MQAHTLLVPRRRQVLCTGLLHVVVCTDAVHKCIMLDHVAAQDHVRRVRERLIDEILLLEVHVGAVRILFLVSCYESCTFPLVTCSQSIQN